MRLKIGFTFLGLLNLHVLCAQFLHGVASGDPLPQSVIIWTRYTPTNLEKLDITWELARDLAFENIVQQGEVLAKAESDYTIKVDVKNLLPNTYYYYRFSSENERSVVGRTKTIPVGPVDNFVIAHITCTNYHDGFWNALARIAERKDIDLVMHSGDNIYESSGNGGIAERPTFPPKRIYTLEEYRLRYGHYAKDEDMMRLRQLFPIFTTWDDHEVSDDAWKNDSPDHDPQFGTYQDRRDAAFKAFHEWMPIRTPDSTDLSRVWRSFEIGDLAKVTTIDSRHYGRDQQADASEGFTLFALESDDPNRTMLGFDQEEWLANEISTLKPSQWNIVLQQVMFSKWNLGGLPESLLKETPLRQVVRSGGNALNPDQWDGYSATRQRIFDQIDALNLKNLVVLSGDVHTSFAIDIAEDPYNPLIYDPIFGRGSYGIEFVTPAVSAGGNLDEIPDQIFQGLEVVNLLANPHFKFNELRTQGFVIHKVTPDEWLADFFFVPTILEKNNGLQFAAGFSSAKDSQHLTRRFSPFESETKTPENPPRPDNAVGIQGVEISVPYMVSPNPFGAHLFLENKTDMPLQFTILRADGKSVADLSVPAFSKIKHESSDWSAGVYLLCVKDGKNLFRAEKLILSR